MFANFPYRLFEIRGEKSGLVVFGYSAMRGGEVGGSRASKVGGREKEIERKPERKPTDSSQLEVVAGKGKKESASGFERWGDDGTARF